MSCKDFTVLLLAEVVSVLEPGEKEKLEEHLASCPRCPAREAEKALRASFVRAERRAPRRRIASPAGAVRWAAGVLLVGLGTAALVANLRPVEPARPAAPVVLGPVCPVNETVMYVDELPEDVRPSQVPETPLDGSPMDLAVDDPAVAHVEWVVPDLTRSRPTFLVRGVSPGATRFRIDLGGGGVREYLVYVAGPSRHEILARQRAGALEGLYADELKQEIHERIRAGERHEIEGRAPRLAINEYNHAEEALHALVKYIDRMGFADPDLDPERTSVRTHLERAKDTWRQSLEIASLGYRDLVRLRQWDMAAHALEVLIDIVGDRCDGDVQRWKLLHDHFYLRNGYGSPKAAPPCVEERR